MTKCSCCGTQISDSQTVCPCCGQKATQVKKDNPVQQAQSQQKAKESWLITMLLCVVFGFLGLHRFYVGKIGTGVLWSLTLGCFGIGLIVDFYTIACRKFIDANGHYVID